MIVSNSFTPEEQQLTAPQALQPPSEGSRQSPCPAKSATFTWLIQSHTVVIPFTTHDPLMQVLHPSVPPSACAAQVAAAAAFG
jgi:hypothetical protein